ncbi:dihydrolipoamide acetyltransferase family protein [Halocalculus aciditolerans]|uniref:Branched-chain alpha-keto acid dehydrogenase subunit E2 n=1 Tax=Halocalculus aciditolerans TaxID=1383812 RepID=A0A830FEI9_9EURY|nr:dihydrolipoamide acetyltransferase family protein [Halocalculus aciditolerans]GGL45790.1 branched-chain alpha-keto acid dehydrogenase subunit E2 [Halocalculus aciditolerans]
MALREFKLPDVGEGVAEGEIVDWLVEEGDTVTEDQPVAEVETDKAVVEVPSPYNGTVKQIHYPAGEVVKVGSVIVTFEIPDEAGDSEAAEPVVEEGAGAPEAEDATDAGTAESEAPSSSGRTFAPPSVRRLARELGVDLSTVSGSGPSGRVTEGDVRQAAEGGEREDESELTDAVERVEEDAEDAVERMDEEVEAEVPLGEQAAEHAEREKTLAAPATRKLAADEGVDLNAVPTDEERDGEAFVSPEAVTQYARAQREAKAAEERAESSSASATASSASAGEERVESRPYRGIRRTIGKQMAKSKYTAPHVSHHDTVDISDLVEVRAELKERAAEQDVKLTYLPFIMKAVVAALKENPILNSELREDDEEVLVKHYYNIGIAVATDAGLMVPVVKRVDEKGILELAEEVNELAAKARDRSITREEMQGGTFTLTNFGAIGGEYATPIINYPETAILGLGAIDERPVAEDGEVYARPTLPLSLSIDHRVIDGAEGAAFTNKVMEYLNNPTLLLLE